MFIKKCFKTCKNKILAATEIILFGILFIFNICVYGQKFIVVTITKLRE
jgi:hypothetical protein